MTTQAWKVTTHDLRPPVQGGEPIWDGLLPHDLPVVEVDRSLRTCAAGWSACREPHDALRIGRLWPDGRPSRLWHVETCDEVVERGVKLRAATWTILREATGAEVEEAIHRLSAPFGDFAGEIAQEQIAWRAALVRPGRDPVAVEAGLRATMEARGLVTWELRCYPTPQAIRDVQTAADARSARTAWAVWDARDVWGVWDAEGTWDAWDVLDTWVAWDARTTRDAWVAWDARITGDVWAAWDASAALTVWYAARRGWARCSPLLLTAGLRDAYAAGLAVVAPVAFGVLGWAMEEER